MESGIDQGKRRYDLSMSRRTRRPAADKAASPDRENTWGKDGNGRRRQTLKDSLRESSVEEEVGVAADFGGGEAVTDREALASAEEEKPSLPAGEGKHQQMVRGSGAEGVKLVTRCVKVLNKLVNARSAFKKKSRGALFLK